MKTPVEQYQMMTDIWPKWQTIATSVGDTDRRTAVMAVRRLYEFYGLNEPEITWLDSPRILPVSSDPLVTHFRDSLIYSVWHKLTDPTWVCSQIGYDRRQNIFRLPTNKRVIFASSRITPPVRDRRRPPWILAGVPNAVSQFDVDCLAILDLAQQMNRLDPDIMRLSQVVEKIATSCFAALLFEKHCLLIEKADKINFNDGGQLSARGQPAVVWPGHKTPDNTAMTIYAINGEPLAVNSKPNFGLDDLVYASAHHRVMLAEYMGWEEFLRIMERARFRSAVLCLDQSQAGSLYLLRFANQEILVVRVKNSTPGPDGKYSRHVIPVDGQLRPLPNPNRPYERHGAPQALTALNAVASTYGMTGEDYKRAGLLEA